MIASNDVVFVKILPNNKSSPFPNLRNTRPVTICTEEIKERMATDVRRAPLPPPQFFFMEIWA